MENITIENCNRITNEFEKEKLNYSQAAAWNVLYLFLTQNGLSEPDNLTGVEKAIKHLSRLTNIVKSLSDWSNKWPRGVMYNLNTATMDEELVAIEDMAKSMMLVEANDERIATQR